MATDVQLNLIEKHYFSIPSYPTLRITYPKNPNTAVNVVNKINPDQENSVRPVRTLNIQIPLPITQPMAPIVQLTP